MRSRRYEKLVMFPKPGKENQPARPITITNVPRHIRILNAPKAEIHIRTEDCAPLRLGL